MTHTLSKIQRRAQWALDAAVASAKAHPDFRRLEWRLDEITIHFGGPDGVYAGEGHNDSVECAATGNWNELNTYDREQCRYVAIPGGDIPVRLGKVLEKLGVECEWSDEWDTCCECGRLLRTNPDCYSWKPFYADTNNGRVCFDCKPEATHPDTQRWLQDNDACDAGIKFVGERTLAEAVLDDNASEEHLTFVWECLERNGDVAGWDRTRMILSDACSKLGI